VMSLIEGRRKDAAPTPATSTKSAARN